jgi:phage shock protein A
MSAVAQLGIRHRQGHERLKQPEGARKAWETLVQKYPNSNERTLARQALGRMKRRVSRGCSSTREVDDERTVETAEK